MLKVFEVGDGVWGRGINVGGPLLQKVSSPSPIFLTSSLLQPYHTSGQSTA